MSYAKFAGIALLILSSAAVAQTPPSPAGSNPTQRFDQRFNREEARIKAGEKSGALTPREAARLERRQQHIKEAEGRMMADGKLSPREARRLERMQDRQSRNIAHEKHDRQHDFNHNGKTDRPHPHRQQTANRK